MQKTNSGLFTTKGQKWLLLRKKKTIEIDDNDQELNNKQQTNDEATIIVNETLAEIQKEQVSTQEQGREMVEK